MFVKSNCLKITFIFVHFSAPMIDFPKCGAEKVGVTETISRPGDFPGPPRSGSRPLPGDQVDDFRTSMSGNRPETVRKSSGAQVQWTVSPYRRRHAFETNGHKTKRQPIFVKVAQNVNHAKSVKTVLSE